jgi:general secretion pathway protein K
MRRKAEHGFILINVLVVLGLAATVVYAMLILSDISIARNQRFSEAGQALALVRGAEQSAIAALRRDLAEAPESDYPAEAWGRVSQENTRISGGSFALRIEDAQGLFNLNALAGGGPEASQVLATLLQAVGLSPDIGPRLLSSLDVDGPLLRLEDLAVRIGLSNEDITALGRMATSLPGTGEVNINTASPDLVAALLDDPAQAAILIGRRNSIGYLTPEDIDAIGAILPPGVGFQSNLFWLHISVSVEDTKQSLESLVRRRDGPLGPEAAVIERRAKRAPVARPPPAI